MVSENLLGTLPEPSLTPDHGKSPDLIFDLGGSGLSASPDRARDGAPTIHTSRTASTGIIHSSPCPPPSFTHNSLKGESD